MGDRGNEDPPNTEATAEGGGDDTPPKVIAEGEGGNAGEPDAGGRGRNATTETTDGGEDENSTQ